MRMRSSILGTYVGHTQEVCGLKWSESGQQLASGGNDNVVYTYGIVSIASSNSTRQWLQRFEEHRAAVKALAWCPFQASLLETGGGVEDGTINKSERELLSSHGFTQNQLTLWKYPSMLKMAELTGHTSTVLFMTQSPNGCTVASAAGDETLRGGIETGGEGLASSAKSLAQAQDSPLHDNFADYSSINHDRSGAGSRSSRSEHDKVTVSKTTAMRQNSMKEVSLASEIDGS
ncbi:unnamed protein product [Arabidopsis arenosa]|uniref:Uncharacterized protein n=1 Tax=Arabidopsis arenosa TaxID=38785 RepID=A0A8S2AQ27_ARAAE|nr:unnamed protein product [Arabidopsis arenosa]